MIRTLRSYLAALKASSRLGRAGRLREKGRKEEALAVARDGLAVLRGSAVKRQNPAESSALICLTLLVEELALDLHQPGAAKSDLVDALRDIQETSDDSSPETQYIKSWIPHLEARIGRDKEQSREELE